MTDAQRVRRTRRRMELTQAGFAARVGVSLLTVHRWETGQSQPQRLALQRLRELEEALAEQDARRGPPGAAPAAAPALDFAGNPAAVSAVAEALRLAHGHQFNPAFASETARIDPLPHQRIAVYDRMLPQEPLRFLLADDAGAGKTIMTGLYVREMLSRARLRRVLIVPPAGLVGNWERELRTLFRLRFRIVTGQELRAGNPFAAPAGDLAIVSVDTLRGATAFAALRECAAGYDLVVFDEAHKLSVTNDRGRIRRTQRYALAEALAGGGAPLGGRFAGLPWAAHHLLLLTATPHMGRDEPYHHLWRLLDPQAFATGAALKRCPPAARARHFIRRTKEEMVSLDGRPLYRTRACDTFSYDLTGGPTGEQALYDATTDYLRRVYGRSLDNRPAVQLALSVFQRRLASSTWALLRSFERRIVKLEQTAADLRSGKLRAADLRRRQSDLDRRYRDDFYDTHGADEDARDDAAGERNEDYEDAVLGALAAVTDAELQREIELLKDLRDRARALCAAGEESKFEKLREVLEDARYAGEKWLLFTEHRDTLEYLVRRLEGMGFSDQVAWIHGGLGWQEREAQVEHFRRADGARYLVATDAAGEGINLQFCRLMANYDIPWNPARLEQRMGRIHRYGQRHDVRIVNLVAGATREGRVLQVLLEKLEAIRTELRSDKVFDVIGRLFENASLREYLGAALTEAGAQHVRERVETLTTGARVRAVDARERAVYGPPGDVAGHLDALRSELAREDYLQLLPGYVRRFIEKSAPLLDLEIRGDPEGCFSLAPGRPGALDGLLPALEGYPDAARARLRTRRPEDDTPCIWLHPGEPVFDALAAQVTGAFAGDALRGAVFSDPRAPAPYLLHLAQISVEREPDEPADRDAAGLFAPAPNARGERRTLERRLVALRQGEDGVPVECDGEQLLLLRGAPAVAPGAVPLAGRGLDLRAAAARYAEHQVVAPLAEERRAALRAELPDRRRRAGAGFDLRAAALAARRVELAANGAGEAAATGEVAEIRQEQRALSADRNRALDQLDAGPERVVPGAVRFLAHALVVPAVDSADRERYDATIEEIAVRIAVAWERERGAEVQDVSKPALARVAGLPDWPGFDLLATQRGGAVRNIEVKGRSGRGAIEVEPNEWKQAAHLEDRYWLYVVFNCATPTPKLLRVRNPFAKLLARSRSSESYTISAASLLEAAETTEEGRNLL